MASSSFQPAEKRALNPWLLKVLLGHAIVCVIWSTQSNPIYITIFGKDWKSEALGLSGKMVNREEMPPSKAQVAPSWNPFYLFMPRLGFMRNLAKQMHAIQWRTPSPSITCILLEGLVLPIYSPDCAPKHGSNLYWFGYPNQNWVIECWMVNRLNLWSPKSSILTHTHLVVKKAHGRHLHPFDILQWDLLGNSYSLNHG